MTDRHEDDDDLLPISTRYLTARTEVEHNLSQILHTVNAFIDDGGWETAHVLVEQTARWLHVAADRLEEIAQKNNELHDKGSE